MQLVTVRVLLEQEPSRLFLSFASTVGAVASSAFRVSRTLTTPYAFVLSRRPLRLGATRPAAVHALPAVRYRLPLRLPLATFPKASTRPAHAVRTCPCGVVCHGSASSSQAHPHMF